jgi:hypothetical protein
MTDCETCTERRGYYMDAETIANQQEHIAELEADRDHWRELFCEQAGDTLTLDRENAELKSLVRDIWTFYHMPTPYMPKEIAIHMTVEESLIERVAALGLLGGEES